VFPRALAKVTVAGDRVQRPPRSLLAHLSRIRFRSLDVAAALLARARRRPRGSR
jgi:hypothetical protein